MNQKPSILGQMQAKKQLCLHFHAFIKGPNIPQLIDYSQARPTEAGSSGAREAELTEMWGERRIRHLETEERGSILKSRWV